MSNEEIVEWCGYACAFDMLKDNMSTDELLDLLEALIVDNNDIVEDDIRDIAKKQFDWEDLEGAKADADEAAYQQYKDGD